MRFNYPKRALAIVCANCLLIIFSMSTIVFADEPETMIENNSKIARIEVNTVSDAERVLEFYFKRNDMDIQIGSDKYIDYLTELLMFENDENLKRMPQYEDIKIYASEYLSNVNNSQEIVEKDNKVFLNANEQCKTIASIKKEAEEENASLEKYSIVSDELATQKGYSDSKAVAYARKWAKSRNALYNSYSSDCTNFVSQCVKAGGKTMHKPSSIPIGVKQTTKYWYSVRYEEWHTNHYIYKWNESTSFIRVSDFYTYWKNKGIQTASYSSKAKLQNGASTGDIIQLKNGKGKWFHSIIITGGSKGARKYCGHSSNRLDEPVKNISGAVTYRALKF